MSTQQKTKILRMVSMKPRHIREFTEGDLLTTVNNRHIERNLADLTAEGLICKQGENYVITEEGMAQVHALPEIVPSRIYTHAASTQPYVPPVWKSPRPGADDHRQYHSRGLG